MDHGKTSLLDRIRGSAVAEGEAGGITQAIGATDIPLKTIKAMCRGLLKDEQIRIPGLLFIDTPGHEAFTTLRRRGGSIADLGILIVDVTEGLQPQTIESLTFLKEFQVPFIVVANKIDKIRGWVSHEDAPFMESYEKQNADTKELLDNAIYELMGEFSQHGFTTDRFDRVKDFRKNVAIVPACALTGEGIPDTLTLLIGLAQQFLEGDLTLQKEIGCGSVLEIKEVRGLGTTIDVILYDGAAHKGDALIIGGETPKITRVKALLEPRELEEMRVESQFQPLDEVSAAAGVKIAAPDLEGVIPGSPVRIVPHEEDVEAAVREVEEEVETVAFDSHNDGVLLKADTLGSLEALIKIVDAEGIPIRRASIGNVTKADVLEQGSVTEPYNKAVFAFNVSVRPEAEEAEADTQIFDGSVIYRLLEEYAEWRTSLHEQRKMKQLEAVTRPGRVKLLPDLVFRTSKPAIVGVEVEAGVIKPGYNMVKGDSGVGKILQIQHEGVNVQEAKAGDRVALSIDGATVGRQIAEGDVLYTMQSRTNLKQLEKIQHMLTQSERDLITELKEKILQP